jgi:hypothetical protein
VDNRHLPYINAILVADIKGKAKFTLMFLIDSMDFQTRETYIGQTALAKKMGVSYDSAADGLDLLEDLKLIETIGIRPTHPGSSKATTVYRVLLQPVAEGVGDLPTVGDSTVGKKPTVGKFPSNHIQSTEGVDLRGGGKNSNGVSTTHTHTDAFDEQINSDRTDRSRTPRLSGDEIKILAAIWKYATKMDDPKCEESLRSYEGNLSSQRLALLMWWGFYMSKHWSDPDSWKTLDMTNFLRASRTLDGQMEKFRGLPQWEKKYPRAFDILDWCIGEEERKIARGEKKGTIFSDVIRERDAKKPGPIATAARVDPQDEHEFSNGGCSRCGIDVSKFSTTPCITVAEEVLRMVSDPNWSFKKAFETEKD